MALTAERIDEILTNFVLENDSLLASASQEDPQSYEAVMGALSILSNRFGKGQVLIPEPVTEPIIDEPTPAIIPEPIAPAPAPAPAPTSDINEFMVGDIFYHKADKNTLYEIESYDDKEVTIKLKDGATVNYPIKEANEHFKDGTWIKKGRVPLVPDTPPPATPVTTDEELTMDELKEAIKSLKPLAEFDDDIKAELNSLKSRLNALKKKKS
jgi:hypothetical protein